MSENQDLRILSNAGDEGFGPADTFPDARDLVVAKRHRPMRWIMTAMLAGCVVLAANALASNKAIKYETIGQYFFDQQILKGLLTTLLLTMCLMTLAIALGIAVGAMRLSTNPTTKAIAWFYTWLFRGVPVLLQMIFWFNLALFFKQIEIGIPGTSLQLASWDTNQVMTPFVAALLGLGLAEAAYVAEIVRGGLMGVDKGQTEAAHAMGMTGFQTFRKVVMPQAWRIILPPIGNEFITMFKFTSLAAVVGMTELLGAAQAISATNYRILELLIVVSIWYLACTTIFSILQYVLERRLGKGHENLAVSRRSLISILQRRSALSSAGAA